MPFDSSEPNSLDPIGPDNVAQAVSRFFQINGSSVILNVGSIAATIPAPFIAISSVPKRT